MHHAIPSRSQPRNLTVRIELVTQSTAVTAVRTPKTRSRIFMGTKTAERMAAGMRDSMADMEAVPLDELRWQAVAEPLPVRDGYDEQFGARPLKRAIQQELENPLSQRILAGDVPQALKDKRVAVVGVRASAVDNSAEALEHGFVHVLDAVVLADDHDVFLDQIVHANAAHCALFLEHLLGFFGRSRQPADLPEE